LSYSVSVFHFSKADMLTMLLTVLIAFLTDLTLMSLIFRTDSDKFINSLMFKIVLMNNVWWWVQQKLKDFLLCFFIFVWAHSLDCNIVRMCWCFKCYIYENYWQFCWILNERHSKENISLIFLDNHNVAVDTLLLLCHLQDVMREKHHLKTQSCCNFDLLRC